MFVDDGNAFKHEPPDVVFVEIVCVFVPVIVVFAHQAEVALVGMPAIQPAGGVANLGFGSSEIDGSKRWVLEANSHFQPAAG